MNKLIYLLFLCSLLVGCSSPVKNPQSESELPHLKPVDIVIKLTDENHHPLPNHTFTFTPKHGPSTKIANITSQDGTFRLTLTPGTYLLVSPFKNRTVSKEIQVLEDSQTIMVSLGEK
ncbi:hypothetical protein [Risungbinella massiliensis]|uniref:hypothetical protein n=1 Tax=Risungbinella massiliensis TaxID=1329796 RepID=UPI0005CC3816|nr:hypothetical protein [Risungbinella massiliensis]